MTYISNTFPTAIQSATDPISTDQVATFDHAGLETYQNDSIETLKTKIGVDGSAVTTSHDYKLGEVITTDKAVGKTATQTLTNKTLTSPVISQITNSGTLTLPVGADTLVARTSTDTLTNKTLTSPTITTPTISGTEFTNATHIHQGATTGGQLNATNVFSAGTVPTARLASGTADNTTFLRGDSTWSAVTTTFSAGDASDGNVTIAAPTTLTRDMYYNNLIVTSTLTADGYKIFVAGTLSGAGTIDWGTGSAGNVGGTGLTTAVGGSGGGSTGNGQFISIAGGNGGDSAVGSSFAGIAGAAATSSIGGAGSAGGNSSSAGGAGGASSIKTMFGVYSNLTLLGVDFDKTGTFTRLQTGGGAGGGGGVNSGGFGNVAAGGGGGASGGTVFIVANTWAGTFTIKSTGGAGGASGTNTYSGGGGGGEIGRAHV